ncbi:MAG: response regulator transcription factor [Saprospiraceae bacterium]|jgi:two-component system LytT family response regulator|nr:response regulator transcription factor [Saprospiraceae bacterium]
MTAIIIDDELHCTDVMQILLTKHCPEVNITGIFNDSIQALDFLGHHQPDILFLDIEMPQMNGFDLLKKLGKITSRIVFTTAYDRYAIKAFKFSAIDYLLKPIDKAELISAVKKSSSAPSMEAIRHLHYLSQTEVPEKILLPIGNEIIFVHVKDIICCEADGSYCRVYCNELEKPYLLSKTLRDIEALLNNPEFFRPHASWLIKESYIRKIVKGDAMEIIMAEDIRVPVSRNKRQEVIDRLVK